MKNFFKRLRSTVFKKTNFKAFFFFLFFSVLIWVLVQFGKNYRQVISINVEYIDTPKDKIVKKKNGAFKVRMNDNGFNIAWFSFLKPTVKVGLDDLPIQGNDLIYNIEKDKLELQQQLDVDIDELTFLQDTLAIPFVQKKVRKIPIKSRIEVNFAPGYSSNEELLIKPDSIQVSGASTEIDSLKYLYTEKLRLTNVKNDLNGKVSLDTLDQKNITFYRNQVSYSLKVEKFTEGRAEVPIEVINAPPNINLSIFPREAVVVYVVSLENYKRLNKNGFRVICDYSEVSGNQTFLIPKLVEKPKQVTSSRLNINKVQFVIKK